MSDLFSRFENELVALRGLSREFAERFPKVAGNLQMVGETCDDPHVERLIQGVALLSSRVSKRLDDDYPQLTEALLNQMLPHYLKPFPSCAIARFSGAGNEVSRFPRGTPLESGAVNGIRCKFKTAYDVAITPISISSARFDPIARAPAGTALPQAVTGSISVVLECPAEGAPLSQLDIETLRVYMDGEPSFCAALRDAIFLKSACAYVQTDNGAWTAISSVPIASCGFADDDALIPFGARSHPAYRVLTEYFAFPEKFNFFDIDLKAIRRHLHGESHSFTLHLAVTGMRAESNSARMLTSLSAKNLLLACTPVVNLFEQAGVPITVTQFTADYTVLAHPTHARYFEVYSIDQVKLVQQRAHVVALSEFRPFYSLRHGEGASKRGQYWIMRHNEDIAAISPGHEKTIALVNADYDAMAVEKSSLSMELTCTNRDLPCSLKYGQPDGDLTVSGQETQNPIRFLRRPTQPARFENGFGAHWRLISHLTLNHHSLASEGLEGFREMLTLYDLPQSAISQRQIAGIVGLEHAEAVAWMRHKRGSSMVHGMEVRMTLDEEAFVGSGTLLFVQVIDQFLGLYVQLNSFIELVVMSQRSGEELIRCKPRSGTMKLV